MQFRFALIDIETTGLQVIQDKITEIAVIILTEKGIQKTWSSLVNPNRPIPELITSLTGISNAMVANAPCFANLADELVELLEDSTLVAHNARFDYGFLKQAFRTINYRFQMPTLCTIKLFRRLYPTIKRTNLVALAETFSIAKPTAHRAEADVWTLYQLLNQAFVDFSQEVVFEAAKSIYKTPSIPSALLTDINTFPNSSGVYLFYGAHNELPLYIGKSIHLRQRILSHFQSDFTHAKEFTLTQQVTRIEVIPTAGELSALLLESTLIKEKMPLFNRRLRLKKRVVGFKIVEEGGYCQIKITSEASYEEERAPVLLGTFSGVTAAKRSLLALCKTHKLCPKLCGLEAGKGACFSYQLKQCQGACLNEELTEEYNSRVSDALAQFQEATWPFKSAIAIKEQDETNQLSQYLVFNQWRHVGVTTDELQLSTLAKKAVSNSELDTYKILFSFLKRQDENLQLIELEAI